MNIRKALSNFLLFTFSFILTLSHDLNGQSLYENFYFSDNQISVKANAILNNLDEEFIVVGETGVSNVPNQNIKNDGIIIKYSKDGRILKQSSLGGNEDDMFYDIERTQDGSFMICGRTDTYGEGNADILVVKCDSDLNIMWSKSYGGSGNSQIWGYDIGYDISATSDGGFVITGTTSSSFSTTPDRNDIYLIKIDAQGQLLWTKTFGRSNYDYATSVTETQNNELIITGSSNFKTFVIKTDSSGNKIWSMEYSGDEGLAGLETSDGQILILSYVNGIVDPTGTVIPETLLVFKLNSINGQVIWSKVYMIETEFFGLGYLFGQAATLIKDQDDFVISGTMDIYLPGATNPSQYNPFMIKIDSNGDLIWGMHYPHEDNVYIHEVEKIDDGFVATGYQTVYPSGPINKKKAYLLKTDSFGKSCNAVEFLPEFQDIDIINISPMDATSSGGIENSFNVVTRMTDFQREESCQVGCEDVIIESNNSLIMEDAAAHIRIETNGIVSPGISVNYQAGSDVLMNPLFEVASDAVYHAFISPCE